MSFATRYRLGRALAAAAALALALVWMSWVRSHPPTARERTLAVVTRVVELPLGADTDCLALVRLDDGREGRVVVPRYAAEAGSALPLVVESRADGDSYLTFDVERWVDRASGR